MLQTSSGLLRKTQDERPFTKDFMHLFSTLMVSLKLGSHRVCFRRYDHAFMSEEAIKSLLSLKFSQSNRIPDPNDPSRIVTTTTATIFSMAKATAHSLCQRFVDARLIELAGGKVHPVFPLKGALFQLTPKGINILQGFCQRSAITANHVMGLLESPRNTMRLLNLERNTDTDNLSNDCATVEVIFCRFAGRFGANVKSGVSTSGAGSSTHYSNSLEGVEMGRERKLQDGKIYTNTFTGKGAVNWLMDCLTTIERREAYMIAELFVKYGLTTVIQEDKAYADSGNAVFQPSSHAVYGITERGQRICGWMASDKPRYTNTYDNRGIPGDAPLDYILQHPALRLLFREFVCSSLCEENLSFYLDASELTANYHKAEKMGSCNKVDSVRETWSAAYGLYNMFLAAGSPCELNIDYALRSSLTRCVTKGVGDDESVSKSLQEAVHLFELAQTSVFKLMSSDSVPKFLHDPKYHDSSRGLDLERVQPPQTPHCDPKAG